MAPLRVPFLLGLLLVSAAAVGCPTPVMDGARFRRAAATPAELGALREAIPDVDAAGLLRLAERIESGRALRKSERLFIVLVHLALEETRPRNGAEAFRQIVDVMKLVEKSYLPDELVRQWGRTRDDLVEASFVAYEYDDPDSDYDRRPHPAAFSGVLKPPARRYTRPNVFPDHDVITQLDHVTIFDRRNGAVEIQRIDPALRSRLTQASDPLVVAILNDSEYFASLPSRRDLVLYRRTGRDGRDVWTAP